MALNDYKFGWEFLAVFGYQYSFFPEFYQVQFMPKACLYRTKDLEQVD